ncbi:hypothetical protein BJ742DRAFT_860317 [Cladochytrium replicatum]|nr:hypothetical protein BJ742DRAFT_860317 [Cladochytrium replicatum]
MGLDGGGNSIFKASIAGEQAGADHYAQPGVLTYGSINDEPVYVIAIHHRIEQNTYHESPSHLVTAIRARLRLPCPPAATPSVPPGRPTSPPNAPGFHAQATYLGYASGFSMPLLAMGGLRYRRTAHDRILPIRFDRRRSILPSENVLMVRLYGFEFDAPPLRLAKDQAVCFFVGVVPAAMSVTVELEYPSHRGTGCSMGQFSVYMSAEMVVQQYFGKFKGVKGNRQW